MTPAIVLVIYIIGFALTFTFEQRRNVIAQVYDPSIEAAFTALIWFVAVPIYLLSACASWAERRWAK